MILKMHISECILNPYTSTFSIIILLLTFSLNQFFEAAAWWVSVDASTVPTCLAATETGSPHPKGDYVVQKDGRREESHQGVNQDSPHDIATPIL